MATSLVIQNDKGGKSFFIDEGVYTRNRIFRVYLSSKFGKRNTLQKAEANRHPSESEEEFLRASLACCCLGVQTKVISYGARDIPRPLLDLSLNPTHGSSFASATQQGEIVFGCLSLSF